jgi:DNA-directed RNA polymerase specialized sigma24 family protein
MTNQPSNAIWTHRPLTRTKKETNELYQREIGVEAQIKRLCAASPRQRQQLLLTELPLNHAERLREETLVYAIRACAASGDSETAWLLAERLVERVSGHIGRQLAKWRMPPEDADDVTRDLFAVLFEALFSVEAAAEFWEVRFWVCLDRRLWNFCEKRQASLDARKQESLVGESEEVGEEFLLRIADSGPSIVSMVERSAAMEILTETERLAVYLRYIEGLPEESDDSERVTVAKLLGVTGRSVRNYLRRAEQKLRDWNNK